MKLTPILAVLALAVTPAAASATTQWYLERQPIAEGQTAEVVATSKRLEVVLKVPKRTAVKIPCFAEGVEAFWNTPHGGKDETRSISFSCSPAPCGRATVRPRLPWSSTLLESPVPLYDRWEGVSLHLACGGTDYGTFSGALEAKVGDADPSGTPEKDEVDNVIVWKGSVNGAHLTAPSGAMVWFSGGYDLGSKASGTRVADEP
jgi:hypothetical protein